MKLTNLKASFISEIPLPDKVGGSPIPHDHLFPGTSAYPTDAYIIRPVLTEDRELLGFFADSGMVQPFDFDTPLLNSVLIYVKWGEDRSGIDWTGNRKHERFTYVRVGIDDWMEHEDYPFITGGSIEYATDAELKATGSLSFEGDVLPNTKDLLRIKYGFEDSRGKLSENTLGTFCVSYADLSHKDTTKGMISSGTLSADSVLSILQNSVIGVPYTVKAGSQAIYEAVQLIREKDLYADCDESAFTLTTDHTFEPGTTYLEMVNWLCSSAGFREAYPNPDGIILLKSKFAEKQQISLANDRKSIVYPDVDSSNDWQNAPNVVRLLYNTDENCVSAFAKNLSGSKSSLSEKKEITYFEEISDLGEVESIADAMQVLAEDTLKEKSSDVEYTVLSHAFRPVYLFDSLELDYSGKLFQGEVVNIAIDLEPSARVQTKIKKENYSAIEIESGTIIYREVDDE